MKQEYQLLLEQAKQYSIDYVDSLNDRPVFPGKSDLQNLEIFDDPLPKTGCGEASVMKILHSVGSAGTTAQTGGRYFGFVTGGLLPIAHAAQWLADTWNQNSALYLMSPVAAKLESICERWLAQIFGLPEGTAMGLVTGSANALICALAAARNSLYQRQGYDLAAHGLRGAPMLRVIVGADAHSCVLSALKLLGFGGEEIETAPTDEQGRINPETLPEPDGRTILILQAGNVNGGSYDPIDELCDRAKKAGAWVHVDGAFGMWAAASGKYRYLVKGIEKADSYSLDAHKTLNAGYDCGVVMCQNRKALQAALSTQGEYIPYSGKRDGMLYVTEMSRRARSVVLWAVLKHLGAAGVEQLIDRLCEHTAYFAGRLEEAGFLVVNPPYFNQFMVKGSTEKQTQEILEYVQKSGVCWCGGSRWKGEPVIRISVCSHSTTREDIDKSVKVFIAAKER